MAVYITDNPLPFAASSFITAVHLQLFNDLLACNIIKEVPAHTGATVRAFKAGASPFELKNARAAETFPTAFGSLRIPQYQHTYGTLQMIWQWMEGFTLISTNTRDFHHTTTSTTITAHSCHTDIEMA
jgi:hypothetical protein